MMNFNSMGNFTFGYHLHHLFGYLLLIATILIIVWAVRFAKKNDLKKWIIGLIVVGLIGFLLTASMSGFGSNRHNKGMMTGGMFECMQNEECHEGMEEFMHNTMELEHNE